MEGREAKLNKVRRQAEGRSKAKVPSRAIQPKIMTPSIIAQNQPVISNGALVLEPMDNTPSLITTPQDLRNVLSPMSPVGIDNINPEPEDPESGRFLASLIAQGLTGFGTGMMGGSSQDILRATGMFDRMRESDINRQDRLRQAELLRTERLGEKQERLAEIKKREEQAKSLTDPNSEESKRDRLLYEKVLKTKIPEEVTAFDLRNRPEIVRSLMTQAEQSRLAAMPRGGIGVEKKEKEKPSKEKLLNEYNEHTKALQSSIAVMDAIKNLKRTSAGRFTPDFSSKTKAEVGTIDREAQPQVKVLAGPGAVTDSERTAFLQLVPNSNMPMELGIETTKRTLLEGTSKAMAKLRADRDVGLVNETDFKKIINQYNKYLKDPKLELNKEINQDGDIIESNVQSSNTKIVTDRQTGKRLEVDREGNVIREL